MPKPRSRYIEITPELLQKFEELKREIDEARIENAAAIARAEETRKWLHLIAASR